MSLPAILRLAGTLLLAITVWAQPGSAESAKSPTVKATRAASRTVAHAFDLTSWRRETPSIDSRVLRLALDAARCAVTREAVADPARDATLRLVASPLRFDGRRPSVRYPPPVLGADTEQVLGS